MYKPHDNYKTKKAIIDIQIIKRNEQKPTTIENQLQRGRAREKERNEGLQSSQKKTNKMATVTSYLLIT